MARKASQSVKDRLAAYKTKPVRRSFFDDLSADAKQFMLEVKNLYRNGEMPLTWVDLRKACVTDFPNEQWPVKPQTVSMWVRGEAG